MIVGLLPALREDHAQQFWIEIDSETIEIGIDLAAAELIRRVADDDIKLHIFLPLVVN